MHRFRRKLLTSVEIFSMFIGEEVSHRLHLTYQQRNNKKKMNSNLSVVSVVSVQTLDYAHI